MDNLKETKPATKKKSGRKTTWESGCAFKDTVTIRIPKALKREILELAHELDAKQV